MKCPACGADYLAGDRFCGTCGERLPQEAGGAESSPATSVPPDQHVHAAEPGGPACPVCGATLASEATRCEVCGFEPGASVVMPGAQAAGRPSAPSPDTSARVCPVHGPLDPSWTRCPYCLREGREGRLASGPIGSISQSAGAPESPISAPITSQAAVASPAPVSARADEAPPPPRMEPEEAIVPAAPRPSPQPEAPPSAPAAPPRPAPAPANELPRSSVGATFAIRRRPRVLAYFIEREGEAVGRVHQLEEDVTDIGRDPRNHITLSDVQISGFHARVERGPDGGFLVHDRNSTNGTFVNGEQIKDMRQIDENDVVRLGNTTLVLKVVS